MTTTVLHQWEISPFCGKVRKALRHKGIDFTVENYNGLRALKAASLSPAGKLPVLDIAGQCIADSSAIVAFLETHQPQPSLYPADPADRARAAILEDWSDESLFWYEVALRISEPAALPKAVELLCTGRPAWEQRVMKLALQRSYPKKLKAQGLGLLPPERIQAQFFEHLASLEAMLAAGPWLVGPSKSIADLAISAQLDEVVRTSPLAPRVLAFPGIRDWLARCA